MVGFEATCASSYKWLVCAVSKRTQTVVDVLRYHDTYFGNSYIRKTGRGHQEHQGTPKEASQFFDSGR